MQSFERDPYLIAVRRMDLIARESKVAIEKVQEIKSIVDGLNDASNS